MPKVYFEKLLDILLQFVKMKFTGVITFTLVFNQGGIRSVKQSIESNVDLKQ